MLASLRHVQAVCTKGAVAAAEPPASWLPCESFLKLRAQRRQAEQQRQAEAAALAAAEADRRERLLQAAKQRQAEAEGNARQASPQRKQQPDEAQVPAAAKQQQQPLQQQQQDAQEPAAAKGQQQPIPAYQLSACGSPCQGTAMAPAAGDCDPAGAAGSSADSLQQLRQQFQSLWSKAVGDGIAGPPAAAATSASQQLPLAAGVAAADDVAVHVAALRMQAAAEAQRILQAQRCKLGDGRPEGHSCSPFDDVGASSRPSSAGLGQRLEEELLLLQQAAAQRAAEQAFASAQVREGQRAPCSWL